MTRIGFEHQLEELKDDMLTLGSMVEKAVIKAVDALKRRDFDTSQRIIEEDAMINHKRYEIEETCLRLLATQQPMAGDLRTIISVLHITVDLERMADHAAGIAKISLLIGDDPLIKPLIDIPRMAELVLDMLRRSLDSFINLDVALAKQVCRDDDEVDDLHDQVYRDLLNIMLEDPGTINQATYLTWVAHNLERIADRSTNISERAAFTATGKMEDIGASTY
ncbi:MAG: phosphate signaling complex protein PhoU [Chloroflexi bacterium]|nr:phosphate signaling complex protein PhoU [Chloroflexota bacterium]MCH8194523.1 phosphate signaling complex protein PhoU [Chloroflexota bacterium]MCH8283459.1 phosphate signaling complex protein PhoU [Chloroflexota bacterium]MCI0769242.1 phosphate signaling complex protein PhoU [Chloroflexota bacterium]